MQKVMWSVRDLRDTFVRSLSAATACSVVAAACATFKQSIDSWLKALNASIIQTGTENRKVRKATRLELKHRVDTLTYPAALKALGDNPSTGGLVRVRSALLELWFVFNLAD